MRKPSVNKEITRFGKFFDKNQYQRFINIGRQYMDRFLNMSVYYFEVDTVNTEKHKVYGTSKKAEDKVVGAAIELKGSVKINDSENIKIADIGAVKDYAGNITFSVYEEELKSKSVKIKIGDYICYYDSADHVTCYTVTNPNYINYSSKQSLHGYLGFYRSIQGRQVDSNQFNPDLKPE